MPKPEQGEGQKQFMDRCMGNATMKEEFPDTDQRVAVCMRQWKESRSSSVAVFSRGGRPHKDRLCVRFDLAEEPDAKLRRVTGHATVFDRLSEDRGGYFVVMKPEAFTKTVASDDVRLLFNHNPDYILGRTTNGTLKLSVDESGLAIDAELADTQWGRDVFESIRRRDITQMSIGGSIVSETRHEDGESVIYIVDEFQLWDVSPVTFAAFEETDVGVMASMSDVACDVQTAAAKPCPTRLFAAKKRLLGLKK